MSDLEFKSVPLSKIGQKYFEVTQRQPHCVGDQN